MMSRKRFRVLVADPAYPFKDKLPGKGRGAAKHYGCMTVDAICAMDLPKLHEDCWLFLWRPATHAQEALNIARAWGFRRPPSELIWRKMTKDGSRVRMGMGRSVRNEHETCLIFKRGKPERLSMSIGSTFDAPRLEHSRKPDRFYEIVDAFAPGPKVELFARRQWPGWTCLGNEMPAIDGAPPEANTLDTTLGKLEALERSLDFLGFGSAELAAAVRALRARRAEAETPSAEAAQ